MQRNLMLCFYQSTVGSFLSEPLSITEARLYCHTLQLNLTLVTRLLVRQYRYWLMLLHITQWRHLICFELFFNYGGNFRPAL